MLADTTFLIDRINCRLENTKFKSCSNSCFTLGLQGCFKYKSLELPSRYDYSFINENLSLESNEFINTFLPNSNFCFFLVLSNKGILNIISASKNHLRNQIKIIAKLEEIKSILWLDVGLFAVGTVKGELHIYHINNNTNETMDMKKLAGSEESTSQSIHQSWLSNLSFISHSPLTFIITTAASDGTLSLWKFDLADALFSSGNLYVVEHIWDNADFALVGAMTFSSTGEHLAFSKSNRIFVSQLNVDALFKLTHENVKEVSIVISTTTSLIHPCRVSSIIWNTFNSIRIYTLSGDLINFKLNGPSAILELVSNETESLHDLLAKHAKNEVIDFDEEVEDNTNEASLISTQIVSVKKSIPIIGVYPSFHNLIDTICFKNDGLGSEKKSSTPRTKISICTRFLEKIDLNQALALLEKDLDNIDKVRHISPISLFRDILPFFSRSHEEMKQAVILLKEAIQNALRRITIPDYAYPIQNNLRIKLNQFHSFLLILYLDQWSSIVSESEKLEIHAELDEKRNEIFATLAGCLLNFLASSGSLTWTVKELGVFARYSEAAPEDLRPLSIQIIERLSEEDLVKFKSITAQTTLIEKCRACDKEIPFVTLFNGSCVEGHIWQRCSLGYQILDGLISKKCEFCQLKQLNYSGEAEKADWGGSLASLFETFTECIYCGSEMTMPQFRLR